MFLPYAVFADNVFKRKRMNLKSYILTAASLIVIGELLRLIMPNGKTKKTAEVVFALVTILCLISPIVSFINGDKGYSLQISTESADLYEARSEAEKALSDMTENRIKRVLTSENIPFSRFETESENGAIKKVKIYLSDLVIDEDFEHIINSEERQRLETLLGVGKGAVEFVR